MQPGVPSQRRELDSTPHAKDYGASSRRAPPARWPWRPFRPASRCLVLVLALIVIGPATAAPPPPTEGALHLVDVQEEGGRIDFPSDVPADGRVTTSFRVQAASGREATTLQFLASNFTAAGSLSIDRSQIKVTPQDALGGVPRDLVLTITGLTAPGDYTGSIQVFAAGMTGYQTIPVQLHAAKIVAPALSPESTSLTLKLASSCGWFTWRVLGPLACNEHFALNFVSLGRTRLPPQAALGLARSDGSLVPVSTSITPDGKLPAVGFDHSQLLLNIPSGSLAPGHYTGHVRASFDGGATIVDAPIDISVRWCASWAFGIILVGVAVGRIQAFMSGTGKTITESYRKLTWVRARGARLQKPLYEALDPAIDLAFTYLDQQALDLLTPAITTVEDLVRQLEIVNSLIPDLDQATDDQKALIAKITASARAGDSADVAAKVTELRALTPAGAKGFAPNLATTSVVGGKDEAESFFSRKRWETLAIVYGSSVIFVATAFFVALAGLFTLYASTGTNIGAAPLADTLTLFAWGIASDVAGRTLANFRGS